MLCVLIGINIDEIDEASAPPITSIFQWRSIEIISNRLAAQNFGFDANPLDEARRHTSGRNIPLFT